jgi:hypothetical protein
MRGENDEGNQDSEKRRDMEYENPVFDHGHGSDPDGVDKEGEQQDCPVYQGPVPPFKVVVLVTQNDKSLNHGCA